jgi:hypothetical protein
MTVARSSNSYWLTRYGLPTWLTSNSGAELVGAFRRQKKKQIQGERFGIEHVTTSAYHQQSNNLVERLRASVKSTLAAKVAGEVHNWPALLPRMRIENVQRMHSAPGYSPNRMVFCTAPRLPLPVVGLRWDARAASVGAAASASVAVAPIADSTPDAYLGSRDELTQSLFSTAYDYVLARQHKHESQQRARRAGLRKGEKPLQVGDLIIF